MCIDDGNDYLGALDILEELLDKDKSVIAYHIGLGQALVALDQTSDAIKIFERALELFPRNIPLVIEYGERLRLTADADSRFAQLLKVGLEDHTA